MLKSGSLCACDSTVRLIISSGPWVSLAYKLINMFITYNVFVRYLDHLNSCCRYHLFFMSYVTFLHGLCVWAIFATDLWSICANVFSVTWVKNYCIVMLISCHYVMYWYWKQEVIKIINIFCMFSAWKQLRSVPPWLQ